MHYRGKNYCPSCMRPYQGNPDLCPRCGKKIQVQNEMFELCTGTVLKDRYLIGRTIGAGGFGITYIGLDLVLEMPVAVKEYYPSGAVNRISSYTPDVTVRTDQAEMFQKGREEFLTEAKLLARFVSEPGVVGVRDFFRENETAYIVMEYLDGVSLQQLMLKSMPMSFDQCFNLLKPVMLALHKVHEAGLIHRDISPSNLMLLKNRTVKLLDFGTARNINYGGEKSLSVVIKPGFAPEEQYSPHGEQGPWTDIYALSATIYKLITGKTPENSMNRLYEDHLKRPSELGAQITPEQEAALMKGLEVDYRKRYMDIPSMLKALEGKDSRGGHTSDSLDQVLMGEKTVRTEPVSRTQGGRTVTGYEKKPMEKTDDRTERVSDLVQAEKVSLPIKSIPGGKTAGKKRKGTGPKADRKTGKKKGKKARIIIPAVLIAGAMIFAGLYLYGSGINLLNPYRTGSSVSYVREITVDEDVIKILKRDEDTTCVSFTACVIPDEQIRELAGIDHLKQIVLSECTGFSSLDGLADSPVSELKIRGVENRLEGSLFTADLPYIGSLDLQGQELIGGSEFLKHFPNVMNLDLDQCTGLTDGDFLNHCPMLKYLSIAGTELGDEAADAAACTQLVSLQADGIGLTDLTFVGELEEIRTLSVNENRITTLEPLAGNLNLSRLDVCGNLLTDLSGIEDLKLQTLKADRNQLQEIGAVSKCPDLKYLYLNHNQIADASAVGACHALITLEMDENLLEDLDFCSELIDLKEIRAQENRIETLDGLTNCTMLETVLLGGNQIREISVLAKSSEKMKLLGLGDNRIEDLSALGEMAGLYAVDVSGNALSALDGLEKAEGLYYLSAQSNEIIDISAISNCPALYYLDLSDNRIESIEALVNLTRDKCILLLQNNQITSLESLYQLIDFEILCLYGNPIKDYSRLQELEKIRSWDELYVSWAEGWDFESIAESPYCHVQIIDAPLDQQARIKERFGESEKHLYREPDFISREEADAAIREEKREKAAAVGLHTYETENTPETGEEVEE